MNKSELNVVLGIKNVQITNINNNSKIEVKILDKP